MIAVIDRAGQRAALSPTYRVFGSVAVKSCFSRSGTRWSSDALIVVRARSVVELDSDPRLPFLPFRGGLGPGIERRT